MGGAVMARKLLPADILQRFITTHGQTYDYTNSDITTRTTKISIRCRVHGPFTQMPKEHMLGQGCPKCEHLATAAALRHSQEEFVLKVQVIHNNRYDYSLVKYTSDADSIDIICNTHGVFSQIASSHVQGSGCPRCAIEKTHSEATYTTAEFIEKASVKHSNYYTYPETNYVKGTVKVVITCPVHGTFQQTPVAHLTGQGCKVCVTAERGLKTRNSTANFIEQAGKVHGNKYCYANTSYVLSVEKVTITCPIHGDFTQTPTNHLYGYGCSRCGVVKSNKRFHHIPTTLYYFKIKDCWKVGITVFDVKTRYNTVDHSNISDLTTWKFSSGKEAYEYEQNIISLNK